MLDYAEVYSIELPSRLIKEIPPGMQIKGLKHKLINIVEDYRFQESLRRCCLDIMKEDGRQNKSKLFQMQRSGLRVEALPLVRGGFGEHPGTLTIFATKEGGVEVTRPP